MILPAHVRTDDASKTTVIRRRGRKHLDRTRQNALYREAGEALGPALVRLARAYEADRDKQQDLLQEIHLQLWLSLASFDGRCSLRTWVYRIAHNVGATHISRSRKSSALIDLEAIVADRVPADWRQRAEQRLCLGGLFDLIYRLKPLDRQVILLYLEGESSASIAEATGLSATAAATRVHRIKSLLRQEDKERYIDVSRKP